MNVYALEAHWRERLRQSKRTSTWEAAKSLVKRRARKVRSPRKSDVVRGFKRGILRKQIVDAIALGEGRHSPGGVDYRILDE